MINFMVTLNGTREYLYSQYGLARNPFPQLGDARYDAHLRHLSTLGAKPIRSTDQIREHLKGWSKEFIDLCCKMYEPGKIVTFKVACPE